MLTQRVVFSKLTQSTINFTIRGRERHIADFNTRSLFYSKKTAYLFLLFILFWFYHHSLKSCASVVFRTVYKKWRIFAEFRSRILNSNQQLLCLSAQQSFYPTVISSMRQLLALCDSQESYPTVISSMRQLLVLCDSYQSYPTVISSMRQL